MISCPTYGLNETTTGIKFLLQGGDETSHLFGKNFKIEAKLDKHLHWHKNCPHAFNLDDCLEGDLDLDDPLMKIMIPSLKTVGEPNYYMTYTYENLRLITCLSRMGNLNSVGQYQMFNGVNHQRMLFSTNLLPCILWTTEMMLSPVHRPLVLSAEQAPRRMIVMQPEYVAKSKPGYIETKLNRKDLSDLPLEQIGNWFVKEALK